MTETPVSLVIVSRHRTEALLRAVRAVCLQDYPALELVVVCDPAAAHAVRALGLAITVHDFDQANVAAARNVGISLASGQIVAFLDDDSVPEPTWISRLVAPFANPEVRLATGFVLGRNGISFQWRAFDVDKLGWDHPLSTDRLSVTLLRGTSAKAVKALGTNSAFRRSDLLAMGGFDPGYSFYLEDADISLRLAALGGLAAVVPLAIVQHGFASSRRRRMDRAPISLAEIGASCAYFVRRHSPDADMAQQRSDHIASQRSRLVWMMVNGSLEPRDIKRLLASMSDGWEDGMAREFEPLLALVDAGRDFLPLGTGPRPGVLLSGRTWQRRALLREAGLEAALGKVVTVICLSPTTWYHRHSFESGGFWLQRGGVFGRSLRDQAAVFSGGFSKRLLQERKRLALTRPV